MTEQAPGWTVGKIGVVGAGIVGVPMAALLAETGVRVGTDRPAPVVLVQRPSATSGWKVAAVNAGRSPIGGIEPGLDAILRSAVAAGRLSATADPAALADADAILVCVQTDRKGMGPDYGPLGEAVDALAAALARRPAGNPPLVVFESTLAPTSMSTWVTDRFAAFGLRDGREILLAHSPNRVMPGRLVARIRTSDKIAGGLNPEAGRRIRALYAPLLAGGRLHLTNALSAEIVKTLENAARDVRIAFSAEVARWCDARDVDFGRVRRDVNGRLAAEAGIPEGAEATLGLLTPTIGVGGHCLPKDGILLLWRALESGRIGAESLFLEARRINDEAPAEAAARLAGLFGPLPGRTAALMGTAYRPNSEDTRNSPTLALGRILADAGCRVVLHDPYVRPGDANLARSGLAGGFTRDAAEAVRRADLVVFCQAHDAYVDLAAGLLRDRAAERTLFDGCRLAPETERPGDAAAMPGVGRGRRAPDPALLDFVLRSYRAMETGLANETAALVDILNAACVRGADGRAAFATIRELAATCVTGCRIVDPAPVTDLPVFDGFAFRLAARARAAAIRSERGVRP